MRRHGHMRRGVKTFGRVPVGALFELKDDPAKAILQKTSRIKYKVVRAPGDPYAKGLTFAIAQNYPSGARKEMIKNVRHGGHGVLTLPLYKPYSWEKK